MLIDYNKLTFIDTYLDDDYKENIEKTETIDDLIDKILIYLINKDFNNIENILSDHPNILFEMNRKGFGLIHLLSWLRDTQVLEYFVKYGGDIDLVDKYGSTALHYTMISKNDNMTLYLIDMGSDINKQDIDGNTPLHMAVINSSYDIAKILLENGANPYILNNNNFSSYEYSLLDPIMKEIFILNVSI